MSVIYVLTEHLRCRSKVSAEGMAFRGVEVDMDRAGNGVAALRSARINDSLYCGELYIIKKHS
jgi:hypothetical protein